MFAVDAKIKYAVVKEQIKTLVRMNYDFSTVKEILKAKHPEDIKVIQCFYTETFLTLLPQKGEQFLQTIFEIFTENILSKWVNVVYCPKSNEELQNLLLNADFYNCLIDLKRQNNDINFEPFFESIRKKFCNLFMEMENLEGILEIYQCLLRCELLPRKSVIFQNAVLQLWQKCKIKNADFSFEMTHDGNVETLHHHFNNLVQNFSSTDNESVINLIKDMFKVTTFETILDGTKPMLKVKGYKIVLSEIYNSIIVRRSSKIKHIEINAKSVLVIDQNLHFRATNLILTANTVVIVKSIEFNLSGKNAVEEFRSKAKSGKMLGEKGSNGDDGIAGESSGHFALFAKSVEGLQNLKLILNGGNGSSGQNGGDGADGENGIGKDFDEVFNSTHTHLTRLKSVGHILTLGALSRVLSKKEALKSYDGRVEMKCDSSYYLSIHKLDMYVGSDGKPGGKGGKNGIGGDGGKKGNIVLEIDDGKNKIEEITVEAKDGVKGRDGISGINGQNGIEGRDIALANKTWGSRREFGKFQNSKLEIQECTSDDEEAICVKDGSKEEYFKVISRPCARTSLTEYQKQSEQKSDAERSGKAIAVESEAIDIEALSKNYQQIVTSETVTTEEEYEFGAEEGEEVNRILEHWTFDEREEYIPKRQYNAILYPEKMLSSINLIDENEEQMFWKSVTNFSIKKLFSKYSGEKLQQKIKKKQLLYKLRKTKITKTGEPPKMLLSWEELISTKQNIREFYNLYNRLKKLKIENLSIQFFITDIKKAFEENNPESIISFLKRMSKIDIKNDIKSQAFIVIQDAFDKLPDSMKECECEILFFYIKLHENLQIYNLFLKNLSNDDEIEEEQFLQRIEDFMILQSKRSKEASKFNKFLKDYKKKYEIKSVFLKESETILEEKLKIFTKFAGLENLDTVIYFLKELQFLCETFPVIGITFLNSLLLIFEVEGCHVDMITLKYLVDTVLYTCQVYGTFNCYIFPSILLTTEQEKWINKFFIFNSESFFKCFIKQKQLIEILKQFEDENLKILFTKKLQNLSDKTKKMTEEEFLGFLDAIKLDETLYPYLKNGELKEWISILKQINFSSTLKSESWKSLGKNSKKLILFWCNKLIENFDADCVRDSMEQIIELLHRNENITGRFIYRLCGGETTTVNITKELLKQIFEAALHCLKSESEILNETEVYRIAKELLKPYPNGSDLIIENVKFEDVKLMCQKMNANYLGIDEMLNMFLHFTNENVEKVANAITLNKLTLDECKAQIENGFNQCKIDKEIFYIEIVNKILFIKQNFALRPTQKIAILFALKNYQSSTDQSGILQQIATGEGKTLIIAVVSIISVLKGYTVNIVTSSPVLAKRDAKDPPCVELFKVFGLKVEHICHENPKLQTEAYSTSHIIYGDLTNYQRDFLTDNYNSTHIASSRKFDIVIADEVDSLLLDNGLNTLYLSHNIADFEMLHSLIIQLWNLVNLNIKNGGNCKTQSFYQKVYTSIFAVFPIKNLSDILEISKSEAEDLKDVLIEKNIIDKDGLILITTKELLIEKLKEIQKNFENMKISLIKIVQQKNAIKMDAETISTMAQTSKIEAQSFLNLLKINDMINLDTEMLKTENLFYERLEKMKNQYFEMLNIHFVYKYDEIMEDLVVDIPAHLKPYVKIHLKEFILNAEMANKMEPDVEYQVAIPKMTSLKDKNEPQIVIIDRDTGVHLQKTYWHKGLHQFLQLKHGLRLTALSTKAVFISNITFLKKFQCIYGFSGTLGSEAEKKELNKFYGLKSVIIPSSNVKQFYEEQTIITNSETAQKEEIFEVVKQKMAEGRSVLIIADSVKEVNQIFENVKILAECNLSENECKPFEEAILYKRDSDQFEYNDGKTELQPHTLIIATPLASRGTNIKLSPTLISQGGLHVIISFLPKNIRIEEQAFGRAARCGERGTAQLIICEKSVKNVNSANIKELKFKRDANEKERIEKMQKIYETKLEVEKDCLKEFGPKYLEIIKKEVDDKFAEILSKDLRDSWALFLDKSEYECDNDKEKRISATIKFCKNLNIDRMNGPTQPLNILNYAVHLMKNEEWKKANKLLEKVCRQFPAYLPEAQYYSIFIIAKKKEEQKQFQQAENQLCKARNGFAKRLLNYQKLSQIVNEHKIVEENRIFECDTFLQQQKESIKLFDQVIESIDDFFGRIISPFSFITDRICAEASMFLYKRFSSSKYYGKNPPITGLKIKKEINEKNLKNYCQLNGFCAENVIKSLETLEKFENINIKMIQKEMKIPKWEEFWAVLKEKGCLRDEKMHMFVNTLKLPQLSASKIDDKYFIGSDSGDSVDRLFQHLIVTENSSWKELDKEKMMKEIDSELLEILIENEIIFETKSCLFSYLDNIEFHQFNTVTKEDFAMYGIPESKIAAIFEELINQCILERRTENDYQISSNMNDIIFSTCHRNVVTKMIQQKLAFGLAYRILSQNSDMISNDEILFTISLIFNNENNEEQFLAELIEHEIIERTNINLDNLNTVTREANMLRKGWEEFCDTEASFNILDALNNAEIFIERNFGEENVGFSRKKIKFYQKIFANPDISAIDEIFNANSAKHQKYATFDATMTPLKETDLHDSETSHLMITHGITHLLKFHEKKWTKKTLIKSTAITGAGIAQLVGGLGVGFGGALSGVGAVPGAIAAKVLLFEGISDILFGVKGFATGFSDNSYVKHKLIGLGMNVTFCGAAESLKFMKFANEFSLAKTFLNRTNAGVNAGANLSKQVVMWMAPALLNIKKAEEKNIQSQNASEFAIKEIYKEIEKNVDKIFESSEIIKELQRMMQQILILYEDFVFIFDDIFEQFIAPNLYEICYFLVEKLRISIFENGEIEKGKNFEERISKILKSNEFFTFIKKFNEYLCKFVKQLQKSLSKKFMKFKAANNILEEQFVTETDSLDAEIKAKEMIENGMLDLKGKIMAALKEGIKVPLNYDIEEEYSKQLNFIIKNAYSELRNCAKINNEKESDGIETTDATVEATQVYNEILYNELKTDFFNILEQIRTNNTVDSELYAAMILESLEINIFEINVLSQLLTDKLSKQIIIKNANNTTTFEDNDNVADNNVMIFIQQNLDTNDKNEMLMHKNIYDQIFECLPELTNIFSDKNIFQEALSLELEKRSKVSIKAEEMDVEIFYDCL